MVETHVVDFGCLEVVPGPDSGGWREPKRTVKPKAQDTMTLADFIPNNLFQQLAQLDNEDDENVVPPEAHGAARTRKKSKAKSKSQKDPKPIAMSSAFMTCQCDSDECNGHGGTTNHLAMDVVVNRCMFCEEPSRDAAVCETCANISMMAITEHDEEIKAESGEGELAKLMKVNGGDDVQQGSFSRRIDFLKSAPPEMMVVEVVRAMNELNMAEIPEFLEIEVVVDSGAGAHVMNKRDCPGYAVHESELGKAGASFKAANGSPIKNYGEVRLELISQDSKGTTHNIKTRFEAADVTRALWSVGVLCDAGLDVKFNKEKAVVFDANGVEVCVAYRKNGLYVSKVKIRNPKHAGFQRQGQ